PVTRREGQRDPLPFSAEYLCEREEDGFYNELRLDKVDMGSASLNPEDVTNSSDFTLSRAGARFGRNIPLDAIGPLPSAEVRDPTRPGRTRTVNYLLTATRRPLPMPNHIGGTVRRSTVAADQRLTSYAHITTANSTSGRSTGPASSNLV